MSPARARRTRGRGMSRNEDGPRVLAITGDEPVLPVAASEPRIANGSGAAATVATTTAADDEQDQRHRSLFAHHPDAIFQIDLQRRFISANLAAERISGYPLADLLKRTTADLIEPADMPQVLAAFRRVAAGETVSLDLAIRNRGGERRELQLTLLPILAGQTVGGVYGIARDLTEQRRAEQERAALLARATAAEQRAAFLADAGAALADSLDYEETLTALARLVVPQLADWCGIDIALQDGGADRGGGVRRLVEAADPALREQILGLQGRLHNDVHNPALTERLLWVIRRRRSVFVPGVTAGQLVALAIDDEYLRLLRSVGISSFMRVPLTARGQALGAISFVYAGSGRRYTRADLALAEELGRRAGTAVDNARLYREAQQAVQVRDEFLATASHDLRTPVTSIKAFAQIVLRRADRAEALASADLRGPLQSIDGAASRITAQLNELLDLSRLHSGQPLALDRRPTDLAALARQIAAAQEQLATDHRITVTSDPQMFIGMWDGVRLERVLSNLLSNAVKYSPAGSEALVEIVRRESREQPVAVLIVRDRGIGIPAADLPHIFARFDRAGNVVRRTASTGLGLAGAREIVRQHGGEITIESREGAGTVVTVTLPLEAPPGEGWRVS